MGEPRRGGRPGGQPDRAVNAVERGPRDSECLLLIESAELNIPEEAHDDGLGSCCHLDKHGQWIIEFLSREEAKKAVAEADQRLRSGFVRRSGAARGHTTQDTEQNEWLARNRVHERVRLRAVVSESEREEQWTRCETGEARGPGRRVGGNQICDAHSPANREHPHKRRRRGAGPSGQPVGAIDAEERGRRECLLLESAELSIPEEEHDDELDSCCHLDDCGHWIVEYLPRDEARKAVAEADRRLQDGFMRSSRAARGHTPDGTDRNEGSYQGCKYARADPITSSSTTVAHKHGLVGECLLVKCTELRDPEEVCGDELLVSSHHPEEEIRWAVEYLPWADTERAFAKAERDCGWLDKDEDRMRGFDATRGRRVEDDRADGLASFMSQWIALG
ncbi:uncharacterized protein B0H18DRAFT_1214381 [Fomitopsis serialis]|uniref:uncharacterized protein n=1 Tax=Fomitopsis serialis TaxID=139415 RepID=UPI0020075E8A|nr:uncharacterized protein B0H18DRAFT_1214381 [Neoantrodia serialis]KAH9918023.1 hypothetical protein B0H18DRAFT_1214381 [Neoantrodia serialis]